MPNLCLNPTATSFTAWSNNGLPSGGYATAYGSLAQVYDDSAPTATVSYTSGASVYNGLCYYLHKANATQPKVVTCTSSVTIEFAESNLTSIDNVIGCGGYFLNLGLLSWTTSLWYNSQWNVVTSQSNITGTSLSGSSSVAAQTFSSSTGWNGVTKMKTDMTFVWSNGTNEQAGWAANIEMRAWGSPASAVSKVAGVDRASISKVNNVAITSIGKIMGVA